MQYRIPTLVLSVGLALGCGGVDPLGELLDVMVGVSLDDAFDELAKQDVQPSAPSAPAPPVNLSLSVDDLVLDEGSDERVIVQYSDWRCPHCLDALPKVRRYARSQGAQLRFRNFPLSGPCNPAIDRVSGDRCELAIGSICAHRLGRFDAWVDTIMTTPDAALEAFSEDAGFRSCLDDPQTAETLTRQAATGASLQLRGTPAFYLREGGVWRHGDLAALNTWFE